MSPPPSGFDAIYGGRVSMKPIWAVIGVCGGVCLLMAGLPVLLAVGATGFLSANVWLTLAVGLCVGGLATYMIRRRGCQSCEKGSEAQGWQHVLHSKPADVRSR